MRLPPVKCSIFTDDPVERAACDRGPREASGSWAAHRPELGSASLPRPRRVLLTFRVGSVLASPKSGKP
eukprot:362838-Lingulodinium_polyedra.AAC.1